MSPSAAFSYGRNEAHGNAKAISEGAPGAMCFGCPSNLPNIVFGKLGRWHGLSIGTSKMGSGSPMIAASGNLFWKFSRPMGVTSRHAANYIRAPWLTFRPITVALPIHHIFFSCSPIQIFRNVVCWVAVQMSAMGLPNRLGAIERFANKAMDLPGYFPVRSAENVSQISSSMSGWRKNFSSIFSLPIWHIAAHPAHTRNRIVGGLWNGFPNFFHEVFMGTMPCNVKLLYRSGS